MILRAMLTFKTGLKRLLNRTRNVIWIRHTMNDVLEGFREKLIIIAMDGGKMTFNGMF
jgi:hypothetical protein